MDDYKALAKDYGKGWEREIEAREDAERTVKRWRDRARAAEAQLDKVRELVKPAWRTNRAICFASPLEAYAAGRNDFIDQVREVLGVDGSTRAIVRAVTGFTDEEIDDLGGVADDS